MAKKWVYFFGDGDAEGDMFQKELLGGKGANLAEMSRLGIPVPPGFTITTEACIYYSDNDNKYPEGFEGEVRDYVRQVEKLMGRDFGSLEDPLLLSVRSGSAFSMPGMMDTVLNIGLNEDTLEGLCRQGANERFGWDSYRRFIQMYGDVVMGVEHKYFESVLTEKRKHHNVKYDNELSTSALQDIINSYKKIVNEKSGQDFPADPWEQLWGAIDAVFLSWNNRRAREYRRLHRIPDNLGTAANVQVMVFGNTGEDSATGVAFTRDPSTGEKRFYGEYLDNAQGEDVVAGIRTPKPLSLEEKTEKDETCLEEELPKNYEELTKIYHKLEEHYTDMQDVEFTIEKGKLWMLQTRTGKRTTAAAVKIAVEMVEEGLIDRETAVNRLRPANILDHLLHPSIDPKAEIEVFAKGLPASPGAAVGKVVFDADEASELGKTENVILVRAETSPDDIHGMAVAKGILTARGGMTSHAAVVARGMGKPCVAGCEKINVDYENGELTAGKIRVKHGEHITINGSTGEVISGEAPLLDEPEMSDEFKTLMSWADEFRKLGVRTNADTPEDALKAREFGAEGIGLCRTEHMFFQSDRIFSMRKMILAENVEKRKEALAELLPMQRDDFEGIFRAMDGYPVTIRLLDPPLHEFLPTGKDEVNDFALKAGVDLEEIMSLVEALREANPMLGLRGCRLGILYPEITEMQARAIFEAAVKVKNEGVSVYPEIMVPLVSDVTELRDQRDIIESIAAEVFETSGLTVDYLVGTMIELPRACLTADRIATVAQFFSYGTNDLTQTTFGLSRDDAGRFLSSYVERGLFPEDPFQVLDRSGVGELVRIGVEKGRETNKALKIGVCGEHGGEPSSVIFCHNVGLNYVSCSPFRVPIAPEGHGPFFCCGPPGRADSG
jgi:pyruvate,orthophosphate dikinase